MNIALIFAGGIGQRMQNVLIPKQFIEIKGKPIIIYTIEAFSNSKLIDEIIVVTIDTYIDYLKKIINKFNIDKIRLIVQGGSSGQESIYNGLCAAKTFAPPRSLVLIHDGVRPFIDDDTISKNISCAKKFGNAITATPSIETVITKNSHNHIEHIIDRDTCYHAKAPQTFYLEDILRVQEQAHIDNFTAIDSASLMHHYGYKLNIIEGNLINIKITTPQDLQFMQFLLQKKNS